jgi:hypothetical protein
MEFLDISSLGAAYRYAIKIKQKLKQKTRQFGPGNPSQKSQERAAPTHKTKDRVNMDSIRTTSPSRKERRTSKRQRKILGSGVTSIRALGITLLTIAQSSRWWPKSKPLNQMQILTLSQNQKGEDGSLMRNPMPPLLPPSFSLVNQTIQKKKSDSSIHRCG